MVGINYSQCTIDHLIKCLLVLLTLYLFAVELHDIILNIYFLSKEDIKYENKSTEKRKQLQVTEETHKDTIENDIQES